MVMLDVDKKAQAMPVVISVKKFLSKSAAPSMLGSLLGMGALQLHGTSVRAMKRQLNRVITDVMRALSAAAIGVMLVGSIGAAILIAAAIRQRRYEFGILRAVGATRGQIVRMVIAQMSLLVFAGIVIGAFVGIYIAFMATRVDHRMAGFDSRFIISWESIIVGALITGVLALAFAIGPALGASRAGIRALVGEGRG
jgi:putative ABC transport system permease protein